MPRARKRDIQKLSDEYNPNFIIGVPSKPNVPSLWIKWVSSETKQDIVDKMYKNETSDIALDIKYEFCLMSVVVSKCIDDGCFSKDDDIWLYDPDRKFLFGQFHPEHYFQGSYNIKIVLPFFDTSPSEQQRYQDFCSMKDFFAERVNNKQMYRTVEAGINDIYKENRAKYDKLIKDINKERERTIDLYLDGRISKEDLHAKFDDLKQIEGSLVEPTLPEQEVDI